MSSILQCPELFYVHLVEEGGFNFAFYFRFKTDTYPAVRTDMLGHGNQLMRQALFLKNFFGLQGIAYGFEQNNII